MPSLRDLASQADQLRGLHHGDEPLVLPNVWDAVSARAVQEAGFAAVASSSVAVAAALGWPDGQQIPVDEMFAAVGRIAGAVEVPVTADLEAGYGLDPADFVRRMLDAGVVGCNLEDTDHSDKSLRDPAEQAAYLAAVKAAGRAAGVDIVLNARIDIFVRRHTETSADIEEALQRARIYLDAGADCIYPILVHEEQTIAALVDGIAGPVNVYALADGPPLRRLAELGVKRISFAGRMQRELMANLATRLQQIRAGD